MKPVRIEELRRMTRHIEDATADNGALWTEAAENIVRERFRECLDAIETEQRLREENGKAWRLGLEKVDAEVIEQVKTLEGEIVRLKDLQAQTRKDLADLRLAISTAELQIGGAISIIGVIRERDRRETDAAFKPTDADRERLDTGGR